MSRRQSIANAALVAISLLALLAILVWRPKTAQAQYQIEGHPVKKSWGSLRGNYIDPTKHDLRLIFEDPAGTIRIVSIEPTVMTAIPVMEFKRE